MIYRVPYNKSNITNYLYLRLIIKNLGILIIFLHLFIICVRLGALIIAFGLDSELFVFMTGFLASLILLITLIIRIMKYHILLLLLQLTIVMGWTVFALWLMIPIRYGETAFTAATK